MIQVEGGNWSIPIAPQGAVERSFGNRKIDLNVAYAVDIRAITFPVKKGQDPNNPNAERIANVDLVVVEAGFEGIEREINMPLPKPIPQGADEKTLRSLLFAHELWFNLLLSIGYADQHARQIVTQGGVNASVLQNAPGRGRAFMHVAEDEYESVVKDPNTKQPVIDLSTGQPKKEKRIGEERSLCSPTWYQNNSASAARKRVAGQPNAGAQPGGPGGFQPTNAVPPGMVSQPPAAVPTGGFAAPPQPGSPFTGVPGNGAVPGGGFAGAPGAPGGGVPAGPMGTLTTPRA